MESSPRGVVNPELLDRAGLELEVDRQSGRVQLRQPLGSGAASSLPQSHSPTIVEEGSARGAANDGSAVTKT